MLHSSIWKVFLANFKGWRYFLTVLNFIVSSSWEHWSYTTSLLLTGTGQREGDSETRRGKWDQESSESMRSIWPVMKPSHKKQRFQNLICPYFRHVICFVWFSCLKAEWVYRQELVSPHKNNVSWDAESPFYCTVCFKRKYNSGPPFLLTPRTGFIHMSWNTESGGYWKIKT